MPQSTKDFSSKQEAAIAKILGWKVVSGSGSRACHPGDIESDIWLGECKTHTEQVDHIEFRIDHWVKIFQEASSKFKHAVLFTDDGTQNLSRTWCVFSTRVTLPKIAKVFPYKKKFRTNIKMKYDDVGKAYTEAFDGSNNPVFEVELEKGKLYFCSLNDFMEMFGGK